MTDSFEALKKNRGTNQLSDKLSEMTGKQNNSYTDERIWKPTQDKAGNFQGVIRFLPAAKGSNNEIVKRYNHGFEKVKGGGKWFIENCPTSIGEKCPVCEANNALWETGDPANREIVSGKAGNGRKRKTSYYANILVIKDPSNPENEGKTFMYRFGVKIFEKISAAAESNEALGESGVNVCDFWEGADFVIKMRKNDGGFITYEDSYFKPASELFEGNDDAKKEIWQNLYNLDEEILGAKNFMAYEDIQKKFDKFLGSGSRVMGDSDQPNFDTPQQEPARKTTAIFEEPANNTEEAPFESNPVATSPAEPGMSPLDRFKQLSKDT